jgi:uroporphyrin-III C-methyltransferase/precorrin-2 dehydrogenase/sirohydrochlorin ferrochelatase
VSVIAEGTLPQERTAFATLETLAQVIANDAIRPPAIIVIGDVVAVARPDLYAADRG